MWQYESMFEGCKAADDSKSFCKLIQVMSKQDFGKKVLLMPILWVLAHNTPLDIKTFNHVLRVSPFVKITLYVNVLWMRYIKVVIFRNRKALF